MGNHALISVPCLCHPQPFWSVQITSFSLHPASQFEELILLKLVKLKLPLCRVSWGSIHYGFLSWHWSAWTVWLLCTYNVRNFWIDGQFIKYLSLVFWEYVSLLSSSSWGCYERWDEIGGGWVSLPQISYSPKIFLLIRFHTWRRDTCFDLKPLGFGLARSWTWT